MIKRCAQFGLWLCCCGIISLTASALCANAQTNTQEITLDKVVAVINNRAILASDIENEIELSFLEPQEIEHEEMTRQRALELLISRTLIEQQIRQTEETSAMPSQQDVDAHIAEVRKKFPDCQNNACATDNEWKEILAKHGLTTRRVENYMRYKLEILNFVELRFREGTHISQEEISNYYNNVLLPQYPINSSKPTLEDVSPHIEEILLEQHINIVFSDWLRNLREQGNIEILDPTLENRGEKKNP